MGYAPLSIWQTRQESYRTAPLLEMVLGKTDTWKSVTAGTLGRPQSISQPLLASTASTASIRLSFFDGNSFADARFDEVAKKSKRPVTKPLAFLLCTGACSACLLEQSS
jgi:hypothetical protein